MEQIDILMNQVIEYCHKEGISVKLDCFFKKGTNNKRYDCILEEKI